MGRTEETTTSLSSDGKHGATFPDVGLADLSDGISSLESRLKSVQQDMKVVLSLLTDNHRCSIQSASSIGTEQSHSRISRPSSYRSRRSNSEARQESTLYDEWQQYSPTPKSHQANTLSSAIVAAQSSSLYRSTSSGASARSNRSKSLMRAKAQGWKSRGESSDGCLLRLVSNGTFELGVALLIFANAVVIGLQTDAEAKARNVGELNDAAFQIANLIFAVFFMLELALRIAAYKTAFFCGAGKGWNYLDMAIVISSSLELVSMAMSAVNLGQFRVLRLVRITKLMRVIRIARVVRTIRALRVMVNQLLATLRSLVWALVLLFLIVYVFAILLTESFTGNVQDSLEAHEEHLEALIQHWSSLSRSMLTLFQAVTGGLNWSQAFVPLADFGPFTISLFVVYICFIQFAVLNVLTGVFCQTAIESAGHDQELVAQNMLEHKHVYVQKVKSFFQDLDVDGSGVVPASELKERLNDLKVQAYFETLDLDLTDLNAVMMLMNLTPTSEVNVEDFVDGCLRLKGGASNLGMAKLSRIQEEMKSKLHNLSRVVQESMMSAESLDSAEESAKKHLAAEPLAALALAVSASEDAKTRVPTTASNKDLTIISNSLLEDLIATTAVTSAV